MLGDVSGTVSEPVMATEDSRKVISFRDLTDKKDVSFEGGGDFYVGLTADGSLTLGSDSGEQCMTLLQVTHTDDGGLMLASMSRDLPCIVNEDQTLCGEIVLNNGTKLEIAGKNLVFVNGPVPKQRRKLPKTPGMPLVESPPEKPRRFSPDKMSTETNTKVKQEDGEEDEGRKWLESSWCELHLPTAEQQMISDLQTPDQISIVAGSYFCRQLRLFTDLNLTSELIDAIFKLFRGGVSCLEYAFQNYLKDIYEVISRTESHQNAPMHGPAIRLLTELLKHYVEPLSRIQLILDLIWTFSHFDVNLATFVKYGTTAIVLGSMSVYQEEVKIQEICVDIVSRIARYKPHLNRKAPIREAAVEMVLRAMEQHFDNVKINRSGCRVLASVSSNLIDMTNSWLESEQSSSAEVVEAVEKYEDILVFIFDKANPVVQSRLQRYYSDIGVNREGRLFLYNYAKLEQLKKKKEHWLQQSVREPEVDKLENTKPTNLEQAGTGAAADKQQTTPNTERPQGILKKTRSFENLRNSGQRQKHRLTFTVDTVGGSDSEEFSSDTDEDNYLFEGHIPTHLDVEEDFNCHVVRQLLKNTVGDGRSQHSNKSDTDSDDDAMQITVSPNAALQSRGKGPAQPSASDQTVPKSPSIRDTTAEVLEETNLKLPLHNCTPTSVSNHTTANCDTPAKAVSSQMTQNYDTPLEVTQSNNGHEVFKDTTESQTEEERSGDNKPRSDVPGYVQKIMSLHSVDKTSVSVSNRGDLERKEKYADEQFLEKLVRTQVIVYVSCLICEGRDPEALQVIDQPIRELLQVSSATGYLVEFAGKQYDEKSTLLDLDPAIVISIIDAVRYRDVACKLLQSSLKSMVHAITKKLQQESINTAVVMVKCVLDSSHLVSLVTEGDFQKEFCSMILSVTEGLMEHSCIRELRQQISA